MVLCSEATLWDIEFCCELPPGACAGASGRQSTEDFSGLGTSSGFGGAPAGGIPQGLAASIGMSSSSSMSDPLGWMGPSDARNTGKCPSTPRWIVILWKLMHRYYLQSGNAGVVSAFHSSGFGVV